VLLLLGSFRLLNRRRDLPKVAEEVVALRDRDRKSLDGTLLLVTLASEVVACFLRHRCSILRLMASLSGCRAKTERAKQHLRDLYGAYQGFIQLNPYGIVLDHDPDTGERVWRARVSHNPPLAWAPTIGDIVHNLRAALDYLAWELVIAGGGTPDKHTQFPVRYTPEKTPGEHKTAIEGQVEGAGADAVTLIDRIQPYRSSEPERHPLYVLHTLDIRDKHQLLLVVGAALTNNEVGIGEGYIESMVIGGGGIESPLKDGTELLRLSAGSNVDVHGQYTFEVAFKKDGPGEGEPVIPTLNQLVGFVDETLTLFAPLI
jgi:hypothetical protein